MAKTLKERKQILIFNAVLFVLNFIYVFFLGIFPFGKILSLLYGIVITILFVLIVYATRAKNKLTITFVTLTIIALWLSQLLDKKVINDISGLITILFFLVAIIRLIVRISKSPEVGGLEFFEAVNIYFLLGIIGSVLFRLVYAIDGSSFAVNQPGEMHQSDFIYYSFVTLTTLGYGDISPVNPLARSIAILISVSGQLYLTMIIALLVGKYLSAKSK